MLPTLYLPPPAGPGELGHRFPHPLPEAGVQLATVCEDPRRAGCRAGEDVDSAAPD